MEKIGRPSFQRVAFGSNPTGLGRQGGERSCPRSEKGTRSKILNVFFLKISIFFSLGVSVMLSEHVPTIMGSFSLWRRWEVRVFRQESFEQHGYLTTLFRVQYDMVIVYPLPKTLRIQVCAKKGISPTILF